MGVITNEVKWLMFSITIISGNENCAVLTWMSNLKMGTLERKLLGSKRFTFSANCTTKVFVDINARKSNVSLTIMKTSLETEPSIFKNHLHTLS